ncbi:TIR domain-containing protein [Nonomuraea rhodomycinica]|uniref:TIR domain-containing protein n=2 Tax=Nonomuraea rhodomycinica TaxID=1712872 RepID=A0A7Y6MEK2_9ACTN|nr:TIR domain-containing protein [Nonomuraea rhodomycinica]
MDGDDGVASGRGARPWEPRRTRGRSRGARPRESNARESNPYESPSRRSGPRRPTSRRPTSCWPASRWSIWRWSSPRWPVWLAPGSRRSGPRGRGERGPGYDAFISYAHGPHDRLAVALQRRVERFAKPWYRSRALRVFMDRASLAAAPELWPSIERALEASAWLILLTSAKAASSAWVDREVAWWLAHRSPRRLLVVALDGGLAWDQARGDWAATAAVPAALRGVLPHEPLWVDLSGLTGPGAASPSAAVPGTTEPRTANSSTTEPRTANPGTTEPGTTEPGTTESGATGPAMPDDPLISGSPVILGDPVIPGAPPTDDSAITGDSAAPDDVVIPDDLVAAVAAPLRGLPKDLLVGEHLRERRRTMRWVRVVVTVLTVLLVTAVAAARIAVGERDEARTQARVATSRQLAAEAVAALPSDLDRAQLLAVAGYRTDRNPQTRSALFQAVTAAPHLVGYLHAGARVSALAASGDGRVVVAGTADGRLVRWCHTCGTREETKADGRLVWDVAAGADGSVVAAADGESAVVWTREQRMTLEAGRWPARAAVSPSGHLVALLEERPGAERSVLAVHDLARGTTQRRTLRRVYARIAFTGEAAITLIDMHGPWERRAVSGLRRLAGSGLLGTPMGGYTLGMSADGRHVGFCKYGEVTTWATTGPPEPAIRSGAVPYVFAESLAISEDGGRAAVAQSGTIRVVPLKPGTSPSPVLAELTGNADTDRVVFAGGPTRLASTSGDDVVLWDLERFSRLGTATEVPSLEQDATAGVPPRLEFSPSGRRLALASAVGRIVTTFGVAAGRLSEVSRSEGQVVDAPSDVPLWFGERLARLGPDRSGLRLVDDGSGRVLARWPVPAAEAEVAEARQVRGGTRLVGVSSTGAVSTYDTRTGEVRRLHQVPGSTWWGDTAIRADGGGAVTGALSGEGTAYVDLLTGAAHEVGEGRSSGVVFAREGLVIQRESGPLELWDVQGRRLLRTLPGVGNPAGALAVSPDGGTVARVRADGFAVLTALGTGDPIGTFPLPVPENATSPTPWDATAMAFTRDGRHLVTATSGGRLAVWPVDPADWRRIACRTAGRSLTSAEWNGGAAGGPPPASCDR